MDKFTAGFGVVFKHNPYHDELGRFSSADSAKFVSTGPYFSAALDKLKKKMDASREADNSVEYRRSSSREESAVMDEEVSKATQHDYDALSVDQKEALYGYTTSDYRTLNVQCGRSKGDDSLLESNTKEKADLLDSAIAGMHTKEDMTVYRAFNLARVGIKSVDGYSDLSELNKLKGTVLQDHAYASTSINPWVCSGFGVGERVIMEIKVKKGSSAAYLGGKGDSDNGTRSYAQNEQELLLPRNSVFKITGSRQIEYQTAEDTKVKYNVLEVSLA